MSGGTPRPLVAADLPQLLAVQVACYGPAFVEGADVFARRLASPVNCSLVLPAADGQLAAYLVAYRSRLDCVTPLHGDFEALPSPDTLYLHDLAVLPAHAGQGLARALLAPLLRDARRRGLRHTALVAVQGSRGYWQRQGYLERTLQDPHQRQRLAGYGAQALYMAQALA